MPLVEADYTVMDVREYLASLGRRRWESMPEAQKAAHIKLMVAGQRKARLHRRAKKGATK